MKRILSVKPSSLTSDGIMKSCINRNLSCKTSTVITSAKPHQSNTASNLFDNTTKTYYYSQDSDYNFIQFQFHGAVLLDSIMLRGISNPIPNGFILFGSNNGLNWNALLSLPNLNMSLSEYGAELYEIINTEKYYKFIKLQITRNEYSSGVSAGMSEMELFGELIEFDLCTIDYKRKCYNFNTILMLVFIIL